MGSQPVCDCISIRYQQLTHFVAEERTSTSTFGYRQHLHR